MRLFLRTLLLAAAIFLYLRDETLLDFTAGAVLPWLVWLSLAIEMLYRIIPNTRIAIGARKHFAVSYTARENNEPLPDLHTGAAASAAAWLLCTAALVLALRAFGLLSPGVVLILMLFYSFVDLLFIMVFCPFRALFMKNRCCAVCRIYNWDYIMMCAPLLVFPGVYSISLFALSAAVVFVWERSLRRNPHFFMRETNENLRCDLCNERGTFKCRKFTET